MEGLLVLADGATFAGQAYGRLDGGPVQGEVVFNTGMTGYQEVLTDPSYAGQIVVMTYPLIGNYGTASGEAESRRPWVRGFVGREFCAAPSHWGRREALQAYMAEHGIRGLHGIDTRALTRHLRRFGTACGVIAAGAEQCADVPALQAAAAAFRPHGLVEDVTTPSPFVFSRGTPHVVLVDYGSKGGIPRTLAALGAAVTVVPAWFGTRQILDLRPDGVLLSNGPGDPRDVRGAPETVRGLLAARLPLFGICLGHQLLGLALGGETSKMLFGHRGVNHPVIDLRSGLGVITTQNHGYALVAASLDAERVEITHRNLNDGSVEGLRHRHLPAFSVQYHPEACPGPEDSRLLFEEFLDLCRVGAGAPSVAAR